MQLNIVEIKNKLKNQLSETEERIKLNLEEMKSIDNNPPDAAEAAEANIQRQELTSTVNRLNLHVISIKRSMNLIDRGEYGYCQAETCGLAIAIPRLVNNPTVTKCADCLELEERKNRHIA